MLFSDSSNWISSIASLIQRKMHADAGSEITILLSLVAPVEVRGHALVVGLKGSSCCRFEGVEVGAVVLSGEAALRGLVIAGRMMLAMVGV